MSKPLNPAALSYQPLHLNLPQPHHYLPFHGPHPVFYSRPCFDFHGPQLVSYPLQPCPLVFFPPRLSKPRDPYLKDRKMKWVKREDSKKIKAEGFHVSGDNGVPSIPTLTAEELKKFNGKTSLMIKNIPNHLLRINLQHMLDDHCRTENAKAKPGSNFCKSAYDFLYLPMDFAFRLNLGYAFVNFTTPVAALRFHRAFDNCQWRCSSARKKICQIGIAKFQGKDLKENFQRSSFPCHTKEYLPVVFSPPRDGFNQSRPSLVGRQSYRTATPKNERVMVMAKRKMNSKKL